MYPSQLYDITKYDEKIHVEDAERHTCVRMIFSPVISSSAHGATVRYTGLNGPNINNLVLSSPACQHATHS